MGAMTSRRLSRVAWSAALVSAVGGLGFISGSLLPGIAAAGTHRTSGPATPLIELVTPALRQGGVGALDINTLGARACKLSFSGPAARHAGPFVVHATARHVQWRWRVPANATRGTWTASAACASSPGELRSGSAARLVEHLSVTGGQAGSNVIVAPGSLRSAVSRSQPRGRAAAGGGNVVGLGGAGNPFPYGQCTYHAYEDRSDVYEFAVAHGVPRGGTATATRYGESPTTGGTLGDGCQMRSTSAYQQARRRCMARWSCSLAAMVVARLDTSHTLNRCTPMGATLSQSGTGTTTRT